MALHCYVRKRDTNERVLLLRDEEEYLLGSDPKRCSWIDIEDKTCPGVQVCLLFRRKRQRVKLKVMGDHPAVVHDAHGGGDLSSGPGTVSEVAPGGSADLGHGTVFGLVAESPQLLFQIEMEMFTPSPDWATLGAVAPMVGADNALEATSAAAGSNGSLRANAAAKRKREQEEFEGGPGSEGASMRRRTQSRDGPTRRGGDGGGTEKSFSQLLSERTASTRDERKEAETGPFVGTVSQKRARSSKPLCRYYPNCYRTNKSHFSEYSHGSECGDEENQTTKGKERGEEELIGLSEEAYPVTEKQLRAILTEIGPSLSSIVTYRYKDKPPKQVLTSEAGGSLFVLNCPGSGSRRKIASFDLDGTLIKTKSGRKFARDGQDWKWLWADVPTSLKNLHNSGYKVVIFTNQKGSGKGKKLEHMRTKLHAIVNALGIPVVAFMATADDSFRKPRTGMWAFLQQFCNSDVPIDCSKSFYCGDAAGRVAGWDGQARPRDFSCSDRKFASNCGLPFRTPEEQFIGALPPPKGTWAMGGLDPVRAYVESLSLPLASRPSGQELTAKDLTSGELELVLCVGSPAAGKTTFVNRFFVSRGYTWVNQDTLKSREKCLRLCREELAEGRSVVVDNTNPSKAVRALYTSLAGERGVLVRCLHFSVSRDLASHLNAFRESKGGRYVPPQAFDRFQENFETPQLTEGFKLIKVNWKPAFESREQLAAFLMWSS